MLTDTPRASFVIDQRYLIEPLGGPEGVQSYLDGFPEEVYNKGIDSHLVKFLYSLLGPVGVGSVRRNYLEARLVYEDHGLELSNLDQFYGNPFQFGRIEDEAYTEDTLGLLSQETWEMIRSKDARYRNRVIDFLTGTRAGNSPLGMRLVAKSGLGHEVEIIENYRYLYDSNSDDNLGLDYFGRTRFLNEMVILPRQEIGRSEVQRVFFIAVTGGSFRLTMRDQYTSSIAYNATRQVVQTALESLPSIGLGNVEVTGGPTPDEPFLIRFLGNLADTDVAQLGVTNELLGVNPQVTVTTVAQGFDPTTEIVNITPRDQHYLQEAIDRVRPVNVIPTTAPASGTKSSVSWIRAGASSEFDELLRYATGSGSVRWPTRDSIHWIEGGIEHQALRPHGDLPYNYQAFHQVRKVDSYDESYLLEPLYLTAAWHDIKERFASNHMGGYEPHHAAIFKFLQDIDNEEIQTADKILADYAEPLTIDRVAEAPGGDVPLVNGIYPIDYQTLPGVPQIVYANAQFWSSRERPEGQEYIELDLGQVKAINYLTFEVSRKPITIEVDYDLLDQGGQRQWQTATEALTLPFSAIDQNPWQATEFILNNSKGEVIYTRYLRIKFTRNVNSNFLAEGSVQYPWSIDACNLRVGRNVNNQ